MGVDGDRLQAKCHVGQPSLRRAPQASELGHDAQMTAPDILGNIERAPRPRGSSNLLVALTAVAAVTVAGAGIATAAVLGSGGTQPEDVLPRSTVAVVKLDLDPAADQKVAAYRLSRKFPSLKIGDEDSVLSDLLKQSLESSNDVDYEKDVEPWLGKRLAVAAVPSGDTVAPVVAVQITDRDKAEAGLKKLADSNGDLSYAFVEGEDYVLLTPEDGDAKAYASADEHLADNDKYADAVDELEGNQIVTAWVDVAAAFALAPDELTSEVKEKPSGYVVAGVHLDSSFVELTGKAIDVNTGTAASKAGQGKVTLVQKLPGDTIGALDVTGLDDGLRKALADTNGALGEAAHEFEQSMGVTLSEDLPAAVGSETVVAVLAQGESPVFVGRSVTDQAERGAAALQRVLAQTILSGSPDAVTRAQALVRRTPDGLAVGSDEAAVARVMADGNLGKSETFRRAVPDAGEAGFVAYVDVQRAIVLAGDAVNVEENKDAQHVEAVGMSATASNGGNGTFRLRVTFR
jgi:hypothetical protein